MKLRRHRAALSWLAGSGLLLCACGSDTGGGAGSATSPSATATIACSPGSLTAAGSTAQQNAIEKWIKDYLDKCSGANINYGGGGSGQGVQQFTDGKIDFAGSDFPLVDGKEQQAADARCGSGIAINVPMVGGPIAVGYNVPGVTKSLNLSASNLAKIFGGKITNWNDPEIAQGNPGTRLPSLGIQTFHRSDGSGTTYNFTNYLAHDAQTDWAWDQQELDRSRWSRCQGQSGCRSGRAVHSGRNWILRAVICDAEPHLLRDGWQR